MFSAVVDYGFHRFVTSDIRNSRIRHDCDTGCAGLLEEEIPNLMIQGRADFPVPIGEW